MAVRLGRNLVVSNLRKLSFTFAFGLSEKVIVDGDDRLEATVVGIQIHPDAISYRLSWFHEGRLETQWVDEFRLTYPD